MPQVNITQAAKLARLSRSHFHKNYVKTGKVAVSRDNKNRPQIDTAELLRVFGELHPPPHSVEAPTTTQHHIPNEPTAEIELLKQQLAESQQREKEARKRAEQQEEDAAKREAWYQDQIKTLTDTMKLLEAPKQPHQYPRLWYQFWK